MNTLALQILELFALGKTLDAAPVAALYRAAHHLPPTAAVISANVVAWAFQTATAEKAPPIVPPSLWHTAA